MDETITTWVMNDHKYDLVELAPQVQRLLLKGMQA
jgi:TetR/AcrR family fatty acid metabolism transcriptional regulator